jgi:hypothetical protein
MKAEKAETELFYIEDVAVMRSTNEGLSEWAIHLDVILNGYLTKV